jgi:peptidoglycan/LPS O-acetylase OafA/YrhL
MWVRRTGTILLVIGFAMLVFAAVIRDPTALDANIGAGGLTLIGIPVGALGCVFLVGDLIATLAHRRRESSTRR